MKTKQGPLRMTTVGDKTSLSILELYSGIGGMNYASECEFRFNISHYLTFFIEYISNFYLPTCMCGAVSGCDTKVIYSVDINDSGFY